MPDTTDNGGIVNPPQPLDAVCPTCGGELASVTDDASREERSQHHTVTMVVVSCPTAGCTSAREPLHGVAGYGTAVAAALAAIGA